MRPIVATFAALEPEIPDMIVVAITAATATLLGSQWSTRLTP